MPVEMLVFEIWSTIYIDLKTKAKFLQIANKILLVLGFPVSSGMQSVGATY